MASKTPSSVSPKIFTGIFLVCLGLLGYALYLQHIDNLDPCPWCIVQRLHFIGIALIMLVAALHRPGNAGSIAYAVFGGLVAAAGAVAAGYHLHIQGDPKRALECMGGWLERWLDVSKLGKMIPPLLQYDGSCLPKAWSFLGLSIPEWSLAWFVILFITFIVVIVLSRR